MDAKTTELPEFPVFDIDKVEAVFGCPLDRYIPRDQSYALSRHLRREEDVFSALFFSGGKLADHGLKFKTGIDKGKAFACIQGLMSSFAPAHEQKSATVALALHHWCEPIPQPQP